MECPACPLGSHREHGVCVFCPLGSASDNSGGCQVREAGKLAIPVLNYSGIARNNYVLDFSSMEGRFPRNWDQRHWDFESKDDVNFGFLFTFYQM